MVKENIKRNMSEHPILVAELILILILMPLIIWIGLSETDEYATLQMILVGLDVAAMVVVPIIMFWLEVRLSKEEKEIEKNKKWENSKKYRKQFVSNFCVENSYFGTCTFEKDINKNFVTLIDGMKETQFGPHKVSVDIEVSDKNLPMVLSKLEEVYKNADDILNQMYLAAVDQCNVWDEKDSMGNPISLDYVRKNYDLGIYVHETEKVYIRFFGDVDNENGESHLGDHSLVTEIDCSTGEITYDLWG